MTERLRNELTVSSQSKYKQFMCAYFHQFTTMRPKAQKAPDEECLKKKTPKEKREIKGI